VPGLPGWELGKEGEGEAGQEKLKYSTVFIAGAGGLGSPVSYYLSAAGVGTLRICDFDGVDVSNLNRQILHDSSRLGINKAVSARTTLEKLNPNISIVAIQEKITDESEE